MDDNPYRPPQDPTHAASAPLPHLIQLRGSMPIRDVLHTQLLILSHRWGYVLACLALYVGLVLALAALSSPNSLFTNTFIVLGLIIMPAILPLTLAIVMARLMRDARRQAGIFAVTETTLSDQGIASNVTSEAMPWSAFKAFTNSQRVVLLFLRSSNNHLIISRTKLVRAEDWPILLDFLDQRLPRA